MRLLNILFALLFISTCYAQDWTEQHSVKASELLQELMSEGSNMGVVAGIANNDKIVWMKSDGYADKKSNTPFQVNTLTRLASIAKPMTAVAILQLHENGLIDLDLPIQTYLPNFPVKKEGNITTRQILQHTSGIPGYKNYKETETKKHYNSLDAAMNVFADRDLENVPGTAYSYTTYGYVVLGRIIESVTNKSYGTYMQENIWNKAGMTNTGIEQKDKQYENKSTLYRRKKNGKVEKAKINDLSNRIPGGGFYSTCEDVLRFGQALLNNTLITQSSFELMMEDPKIRTEGNGYGMGLFLYGSNETKGLVVGHSGGQTGSSTQLMILPEADLVTITFSNTSSTGGDAATLAIKLFHTYGAEF